ncbi:uncharacterized protein MONOS_7454 [Monocercomonoides exilis]|uniref:uncharacterized protein n=1 Tax=Monocercomonoides exilis TaxID=2049356 RepID=UPI00355A1F9A|nr:hypothetical protein MONOS_7454 [Monocercomonoides exilis]|eukprot:MONOS_7454.1-p1 / transcript=MONOS_7454.1 / gene=MONOS_7454 / organism=Monocercomonoides_exilis_PA203 / gene_product=unspecified product / transcript_product=unspecified product / location=Mono_scaffold00255:26933-27839(-) / protein_length=218 / sequence_SO=supercontig / SO=protein_coding / is_pseudo=false
MTEAITSTSPTSWKQLSQTKEEQKIRILQKEKEREEEDEEEKEEEEELDYVCDFVDVTRDDVKRLNAPQVMLIEEKEKSDKKDGNHVELTPLVDGLCSADEFKEKKEEKKKMMMMKEMMKKKEEDVKEENRGKEEEEEEEEKGNEKEEGEEREGEEMQLLCHSATPPPIRTLSPMMARPNTANYSTLANIDASSSPSPSFASSSSNTYSFSFPTFSA